MSLLIKIDQFLRITRMAVSTFGRRAVGDPRLVRDLRRGRRPGPAMRRRLERFMREHRA